ncbi:MAG TPA: ribosomal protein S18-alanine N-acetyltransferase, partial [Candidatus Faecivivens stercorigallinarum]|nr:ribosomal protein S18-alanine N-acetyltransferase [Candidatus Faecivivens stercorigallinarum]
SQKSLRSTITEDDSYFAVAITDGKIVGYINTTYVLDEMNLNRICVLPQYRKMGAAGSLMEGMFAHARQKGLAQIFLEVRLSNLEAQRVYQRFGFKVVGERKGFYQNPPENGLVMTAQVVSE